MAANLRLLDPRKIVEIAFAQVAQEVRALTPDKAHIYRAIRAIKREKGLDMDEPKSLTEINIEKLEKLETIDGEKILYADTGVVDGTRSLIFTTPTLIEIYKQAKKLEFDATFDVSFSYFLKESGFFSVDSTFLCAKLGNPRFCQGP